MNGKRAVAMFTFGLNYLWSGLDPSTYHWVNIAIHIGAAFGLYGLLATLARVQTQSQGLRDNAAYFAFAVALLWALHPVNTQAVTYIVQRMTSLAALFYILGLWLFVLWRSGHMRGRWAWAGIGAAFVLGFFTKEHVATLPAALILVDVAFFRRFNRWHAAALGAIALCAVAVAPFIAGNSLIHFLEAPAHRDFSGWERLLTQGRVIVHYLSLLVWPDAGRLQLDYDFDVSRGLFDPWTTAPAWLFLVALSLLAVVKLPRYPWPATGWLFFMVALSIESSIILLELAFEHRLYLPSTLLLAGLLAPLFSIELDFHRARYVGIATIVIAGALSWQTLERNSGWSDRGNFWANEIARGASPYRSALNGSIALTRQGFPEQALELLKHAPEDLEPLEFAKIEQSRGAALSMMGRHDEALNAFRRVLDVAPNSERIAYIVGSTMLKAGDRAGAADLLAQLEEQREEHLYTHLLNAEIAMHDDNELLARDILKDFLDGMERSNSQAQHFVRLKLASIYHQLDEPQEAAEQLRAIVREDPKHWTAWSNLYLMLKAGDDPGAEKIARYLRENGVSPEAWAPEQGAAGSGALPSEGEAP